MKVQHNLFTVVYNVDCRRVFIIFRTLKKESYRFVFTDCCTDCYVQFFFKN